MSGNYRLGLGCSLLLAALAAPAQESALPANLTIEQCLRGSVMTAPEHETVQSLRAACEEQLTETPVEAHPSATPLERRLQLERVTQFNPFVLTPYRPNYVLPLAYQDSPNQASTGGNSLAKRTEAKFQFSVRFPVWQDVLGSGGDLHVAYTAQSYWQAYDESQSRPFRETNHEPEVFMSFPVNWTLFGTRLDHVSIGINHQSNGQDLSQSRSWNRIVSSFVWEVDDRVVVFRPWIRIPDPEKETPDDPRGDDNPNIERYAGQFEMLIARRHREHTYSVLWRNNARADNRGSLELGWSFPLFGRTRGYVQVFTGYAESLIDYDDHHNRIGFGILMTDWL